jgi:hypothetical protein
MSSPLQFALALLTLATLAIAADPAWRPLAGAFATFQAPPGMAPSTETHGAEGNFERFECPDFSLTFDSDARALPRELQTDLVKAIAYWSTERRKNWKVNTYVEDDKHLAFAAIRTVNDSTFLDSRPFHLSFGLAAGDKPFAIHFRFRHPEDLTTIERLLQSLKLKTQ